MKLDTLMKRSKGKRKFLIVFTFRHSSIFLPKSTNSKDTESEISSMCLFTNVKNENITKK